MDLNLAIGAAVVVVVKVVLSSSVYIESYSLQRRHEFRNLFSNSSWS